MVSIACQCNDNPVYQNLRAGTIIEILTWMNNHTRLFTRIYLSSHAMLSNLGLANRLVNCVDGVFIQTIYRFRRRRHIWTFRSEGGFRYYPHPLTLGFIGILIWHNRGCCGWFKSYLEDRTQTIQISSSSSEPVTLKYGVPQGSVLGPILFTIHTTPLGYIIRNYGLDSH